MRTLALVPVVGATLSVLFGCEGAMASFEHVLDAIEHPVEEPSDEPPPPVEALRADAPAEPLPERPADSVARSETEVITFQHILDDTTMSREARIQALLNLDPAALQKPGGTTAGRARGQDDAPPTEWEVAAARRRVPIVMYSTSWCGVCKRAREYFESERISFTEYDVDRNASARAEYLRLNPRRSVPTIQVGKQVIVGFSPGSVQQALDRETQARIR